MMKAEGLVSAYWDVVHWREFSWFQSESWMKQKHDTTAEIVLGTRNTINLAPTSVNNWFLKAFLGLLCVRGDRLLLRLFFFLRL